MDFHYFTGLERHLSLLINRRASRQTNLCASGGFHYFTSGDTYLSPSGSQPSVGRINPYRGREVFAAFPVKIYLNPWRPSAPLPKNAIF